MIANPISTSTGSVNNSNVQINQGPISSNSYTKGHQCNGPALVLSHYYMGSDTPAGGAYHRSNAYGAQLSVSIPLDGAPLEICKQLARKRVEKETLDLTLVRALKCAELLKTGYMIAPDSPMYPLCSDIISIEAYQQSIAPKPEPKPEPEKKPEPEPTILEKYPDIVRASQ